MYITEPLHSYPSKNTPFSYVHQNILNIINNINKILDLYNL